ncbi:MAG: hypothetical protein JNK53_08970 [Phycisphaerae bacterium]|nr:hypothetical protein [Phycisphaerae bacterium]
MQRSYHSIIAFLLAVWLPFCCCQVRSAAMALAHETIGEAPHAERSNAGVPPCCRAREAASGACTASESDPSTSAPTDSDPAPGPCCVSCKDRVLPSEIPVPPADTIGADLLLAAFIVTGTLEAPAVLTPALEAQHCTGPPGAPSGRRVLALACILLV